MAAPLVLDDFDHRLLALLQQDAARTLTALGEAVGLSASAVQRRITRYRSSGLLQQVAVLEPELLGNPVIAIVWVTMEREPTRQRRAFQNRMAGELDYVVIMATPSLADYRRAAERLFKDDGNIRRYDTHLVFETIKHGLALPTRNAPAR